MINFLQIAKNQDRFFMTGAQIKHTLNLVR